MKDVQHRLAGLGQLSLLLVSMAIQPSLADTTTIRSTETSTVTTNTAKDEVFIKQLISAGIQPLYRELEQASQQLTQNSEAFCKEPTLETLQQLREAWGNSMLAWQRTDTLLFGPATADQMDYHINFAPPKKQIVKGLLASDQALTPASVAAAGVGAQGLSTLEYLLFDREQTTAQLLSSFQDRQGRIRCSYVQALSILLEQNIQKVTTPWFSADAAKQFTSNQELIDLLIGKSAQTLERINLKKLNTPLGTLDDKQLSHPYDLEAWRSGYSFKIIQANVEGLRRVYIEGGFLAWIDKNFPSEATKTAVIAFEKQLNDLIQMQLPAGDPFTIIEQKQATPELQELVQRARGLEMGVKRQLSVLAKAQLGFNDGDGD